MAEAGAWSAAERLAKQGRIEEAIVLLQARAEAGDESAADGLAKLLAKHGPAEEAMRLRRYGLSAVDD
jgi:hypothetical protein